MEKERILEALGTIQEVCREHESCKTCPLRDAGYNDRTDCMLDNTNFTPSDWILNIGAPTTWRAFCD